MFRTDTIFTCDEIVKVASKISDHYSIINGFERTSTQYAELTHEKSLPDFNNCKGLEFEEIVITGYLSNADIAWDFFSDVVTNLENLNNFTDRVSLSCDFEEKSSAQSSTYYVSVFIVISKGLVSFGFSANGVMISKNPGYWEDFYQKLIFEFDLPMKVDGSDLVHIQSGNIRITDLHPGYLPGGFICELPEFDVDLLISKVKNGLSIFSMDTGPEFSWRITINDVNQDNRLYVDNISNYPADYYDIDLEFSAEDLQGIDYLMCWCEDDDIIKSKVCEFDVLDKSKGILYVETSKSGHKLLLDLSSVEKIEEIEQCLGIQFSAV